MDCGGREDGTAVADVETENPKGVGPRADVNRSVDLSSKSEGFGRLERALARSSSAKRESADAFARLDYLVKDVVSLSTLIVGESERSAKVLDVVSKVIDGSTVLSSCGDLSEADEALRHRCVADLERESAHLEVVVSRMEWMICHLDAMCLSRTFSMSVSAAVDETVGHVSGDDGRASAERIPVVS